MCNKKSTVVVTDGCDSMKAAIKSIFPEVTHRFCAWHMEKNVTANVKEEGMRQCFTRWLYSDMEIDEFEAEWDDAVEEYGFQNSFWAKETFHKRMMWANAYLRDKFCAGFRTTSRYIHTLEEYGDSSREMMVLYDRVSRKMECRCNFWSQKKIPCRHIFFVMKHKHLTQIPERLVLKRWHKDAKSLDKYAEITEVGSKRGFLQRHGALHAATQLMVYVGARCPSSFTHVLNDLYTLCQELDRGHENVCQKKAHDTIDLHDPDVVKTKGAPRVQFDKGKKGDPKPNKLAMQVDLEESGSKIRLEDEIPAATGFSETMEYDRNMRSNTDELLT
ncbi:protein FAR1-RELATED SEQUENCE 8-like [Arachis stenosperma]|uniref:protein FAR1-RELATED SEQUENCE 8-like n=1 Tax=Arachis stenosperma TaxID=217475 RepID=UPI0025AB95CD|nr:protein FAR1-RELATED SEQUENCE 8-like [Arachis stenosperma]